MHTKWLMILSSLVVAVAGLGMTFAPEEIVVFVAGQSSSELTLFVQVIGAGYPALRH